MFLFISAKFFSTYDKVVDIRTTCLHRELNDVDDSISIKHAKHLSFPYVKPLLGWNDHDFMCIRINRLNELSGNNNISLGFHLTNKFYYNGISPHHHRQFLFAFCLCLLCLIYSFTLNSYPRINRMRIESHIDEFTSKNYYFKLIKIQKPLENLKLH